MIYVSDFEGKCNILSLLLYSFLQKKAKENKQEESDDLNSTKKKKATKRKRSEAVSADTSMEEFESPLQNGGEEKPKTKKKKIGTKKEKTNGIVQLAKQVGIGEPQKESAEGIQNSFRKEGQEPDDWQYTRNPNDKLQKEFDFIADEFQLSDSEVKGRTACVREDGNNSQSGEHQTEDLAAEGDGAKLTSEVKETYSDEVILISGNSDKDTEESNESSKNTSNIQWNSKLDMEKIKTPKSKFNQDSKDKKKRKKKSKLKKPEKPHQQNNKPLNLSDVCDNLADVSILSDTSQGDGAIDKEVNVDEGKRCMSTEKDGRECTDNTQYDKGEVFRKCVESEEMDIDSRKEKNTRKDEADKDEKDRQKIKGDKRGEKDVAECDEKSEVEETKCENIEDQKTDMEISYLDYLSSLATEDQPSGEEKKENRTDPDKMAEDGNDGQKAENDKTDFQKEEKTHNIGQETERKEGNRMEDRGKEKQLPAAKFKEEIKKSEEEGKSKTSKAKASDVDDDSDIPMPKHYPSITNFFSKVDRGKQLCKKEKDSAKVTVKADIHSEPCISPVLSKSAQSQKRSPVSGSKVEDEIQVLGSELITVDTPKSVVKKITSQDGVKSEEADGEKVAKKGKGRLRKSLINELNKESGKSDQRKDERENGEEGVESNKCEENIEEKRIEDQEAEDDDVCIVDDEDITKTQLKQKTDFLKSESSQPALHKKTCQATFSFTKAGFQMKKATPPVTRVRKSKTESVSEDTFTGEPVSESTPIKPAGKRKGLGRKKKLEAKDGQIDEKNESCNTPPRRSTRITRSGSKADNSVETLDDTGLSEVEDSGVESQSKKTNVSRGTKGKSLADCRKLLRQKYRVALLSSPGKKGSSICIKLTR